MTYRPTKIKRPPMMPPKPSARIECSKHKAFVKSHACCVAGKLNPPHDQCRYAEGGLSDPHHSKTRGAYGGDETCVSLCRYHHDLLDSPGWSQPRMEAEAKVSFAAIAAELARISIPLKNYHLRKERERARYMSAAE